jgi:hypothetical protein
MKALKFSALLLVFGTFFLLTTVASNASAQNIQFLINGTQVAAGPSPLNLNTSYTVGGVTVNIAPYSSGSAYIAASTNDANNDLLVLKNAKISFASGTHTEFRFTFRREFAPLPNATSEYHARMGGFYRRGASLSAPPATGAKISVRGEIKTTGGNTLEEIPPGPAPPALAPPIPCPSEPNSDLLTKCIPATSSTIAWNVQKKSTNPNPTVGNNNRIVEVDFYLTTQNVADTLQLPNTSTAGIHMANGPPAGDDGGVGGEGDCDKCTGEECHTCLIEGVRCAQVCPPGFQAYEGFWCRFTQKGCCNEIGSD